MGQTGGSSAPVPGHQPSLLPQGNPQQDGGLFSGDLPDLDLVQDLQSFLFLAGQCHLDVHGVTLLLTSYGVTDSKNNNNWGAVP
jgi:hypothetical protein